MTIFSPERQLACGEEDDRFGNAGAVASRGGRNAADDKRTSSGHSPALGMLPPMADEQVDRLLNEERMHKEEFLTIIQA